MTYLVQQGWQRMVFAAPDRRDIQRLAQARLEGVRQACAEVGLEPPLVQEVPLSRQAAREAIVNLLAQQVLPCGICCYNDEVAFAVMAALTDESISIPVSVAVIGCDDISLAQFSQPPLTTLSFDNKSSLDRLIENILAISQGEPMQPMLPTSLKVIRRASA